MSTGCCELRIFTFVGRRKGLLCWGFSCSVMVSWYHLTAIDLSRNCLRMCMSLNGSVFHGGIE